MTETLNAVQPDGTVLAGPAAPYVAPHLLGTTTAYRPPIASPIPVPDPTVHVMPSGHTVSVASPRILTRGQRMKLVEMARDDRVTGLDQVNVMLSWLIVGWSYPFPIPAADQASLDLIPGEDDDALTEYVTEPARSLLFPKAASVDDHADETSPTAPSGA